MKRLLAFLSVVLLSLSAWPAADVSGPSSSVDRAIPTFSGTTGKIIQDNAGASTNSVTISAYGDIYWPAGFGFLYLHSLSSTQRDSRPPGDGMIFFNSTLGLPQYYGNGAWHTWIDDGNVPANMFYAGPYQASGTNGSAQATFRYIQPNDIGGTDVLYVPQGTGFPRIINHSEQATASLVLEDDISLSDNTTNNVSTNRHGFALKGDNDSTHFLNGKLAWAVPPGGSGSGTNVGNFFTDTLGVGTNDFLSGVVASFLGPLRSSGSFSGYVFNDRTTGTNWVWYASGNTARLYNGLIDVFSSDINGLTTVNGLRYSSSRPYPGNLGTIAANSVASISSSTNVFYGEFSGANGGINLYGSPMSGSTVEIQGTNTSGGTQIITNYVNTVATSLVTAWGSGSTITNLVGASFVYLYRERAGAWERVSTEGDAYNPLGGGGSGTVTATGGSLTANALVLGAGTTDTKVSTGLITDGISKVTLGVAGSSVGSVDFKNATSGTINVAPVTGALGSVALLLPATSGTLALTSQLTIGSTNFTWDTTQVGLGAGNTNWSLKSGLITTNENFKGPLVLTPSGTDSTNISWAAGQSVIQGITTNATFTNTFTGTNATAGATLSYVVNNTAITNISVIFDAFQAAGMTNYYYNTGVSNVASVLVPAKSRMTFAWFYDGARYYLTTIGKQLYNPVIPLTYSTTNVNCDLSLGRVFTLNLTNASAGLLYFSGFTNSVAESGTWLIWLKQDSSGSRSMIVTNTCTFPGQPGQTITSYTNANTLTLLTLTSNPFTNGYWGGVLSTNL